MTPSDHESYAAELLQSLSDASSGSESLGFVPNQRQSRNAAKAMTAILCHRVAASSEYSPNPRNRTTFEWKHGTFNPRNIADRDYLWTNMRRSVANEMHEIAKSRPAAYLLACCHPDASSMRVWAVPEPIFYEALQNLEFEEDGQKYTVQIFPDRQRLHGWDSSPDLTPYFLQLELAEGELLALKKSREVDALVKRERAISRGASDSDGEDDEFAFESETNALLDSVAQQLDEAGAFDPTEIADGRERVLSSIVRRRGQPAFRQRLLTAYESRCAITGCDVEAVLDAAHIVPYMGPETNHPGNGLLLRTDLHTLFDLKLVAVDAATMTLLVSSLLDNTCYEQYRGSAIRIPNDHDTQPSREALRQHRIESGL